MPRFTLFKRDPVQFPPTRITAGLFPPERVLAPREKEAPAQHSTFILTVLATFIFGFGLAALFFCLMNFLSTALPNTLSSGSRDASAPNQPKRRLSTPLQKGKTLEQHHLREPANFEPAECTAHRR